MLAAEVLVLPGRLRGVSLNLRAGEVTAICGPNGAGKSSLLSCLGGLIKPAAGAVTLDGAPLGDLHPEARARALGYLPQTPEVAWDVSVATLAGLGRLPWRTSAAEDSAAVNAALEALDLPAFAQRPV